MNKIKDWLENWSPSQLIALGLLAGVLLGTNLWAIHKLDCYVAWVRFYEKGLKP